MDLFLLLLLLLSGQKLGGGNSNIFWNFHPDPWGFTIQFDDLIFFKWGW